MRSLDATSNGGAPWIGRSPRRSIAREATGALLEEATQSETYASALPERVTEALRFVEGRAVRVRCLPSLAPAMRRAIAGRDDVTLEEVPGMPAGFSILAHDGSVGVDETLAARLERLRARLFIELLAEVDR